METFHIVQGESIVLLPEEIPIIKDFMNRYNITPNALDREQLIFTMPRCYVGQVHLLNRNIVINPLIKEVKMNDVLRIYFFTYGYDTGNLEDNIYELNESNFYKNIINNFLQELQLVIRKGLPKGYIEVSQEQKYLTGSINVIRTQINKALKKSDIFSINYDELTLDNDINRLLGAALDKVTKLSDNSKAHYLQKYFSEVNTNLFKNNRIVINRQNYYCKKALDFAYLIINELFYFDSLGSSSGESFLINYDRLIEDFIKKILINYTNDDKFSVWNDFEEYGHYKNDNQLIKKEYMPDIVYDEKVNINNKICRAILDVKNKYNTIFNNQDIYQMIFYSIMLHSKKVILCYPCVGYKDNVELKFDNEFLDSIKIYGSFINITANKKEDFINSIKKFIENIFEIL